jgi:adenylate cyclase
MVAIAPAAERIDGAVVFTDIVGFTEYTALRGDSEAVALLSVQERIVREELPAGARIVKELGDGLLLWFPDACAAVRCALALQHRFDVESGESGLPLWVRMGVHWGQQTRRRDDIVGHDVNLASRIVGVAGPGEVVVSGATVAEIDAALPGVAFDELGPVFMKGIPAPVHLFRALAAS